MNRNDKARKDSTLSSKKYVLVGPVAAFSGSISAFTLLVFDFDAWRSMLSAISKLQN